MVPQSGLGTIVAVPSEFYFIFEAAELRVSMDQRNQFRLRRFLHSGKLSIAVLLHRTGLPPHDNGPPRATFEKAVEQPIRENNEFGKATEFHPKGNPSKTPAVVHVTPV